MEKVNELIKEEVSKCIPRIVGDEVGFVTVLKADVTKDLKKADIWVSILGENENDKFEALKEITSQIQQEVAGKIELKFTPKIELHFDKSGKYAAGIDKILRDLGKND